MTIEQAIGIVRLYARDAGEYWHSRFDRDAPIYRSARLNAIEHSINAVIFAPEIDIELFRRMLGEWKREVGRWADQRAS